MNNNTNSNRNLLKLKLALASGGLVATLIGAGMLGQEARTITGDSTTNTNTQTTVSTESETAVSSTNTLPEALDLSLEAIPTVAAPTMRSAPVAMGRSSG